MTGTAVATPKPNRKKFKNPKSRREVLLDAATLIEERGWTQGAKGMPHNHNHVCPTLRHEGHLCLLGSICLASGVRSDLDLDNYVQGATWIDPRYKSEPEIFFDFNDGLDPQEGEKIITAVLRRLADGLPWEQAIDTDVEYPVAS